ncbi:MAG: DUF86 domain-containing protein [Desulfobacterales bacterium]|nr:DUF86 domain-containing protein [Desulfobacterales bacterium]MBF0396686.1 DUF86 domain-containing protein [Desulfobacterales bacterium]
MNIDVYRISQYLNEIDEQISLINKILKTDDNELLNDLIKLNALKYSVILISSELKIKLKPFFRVRNMIVHRYWKLDNSNFLKDLRQGVEDFREFHVEVKQFLQGCVNEKSL